VVAEPMPASRQSGLLTRHGGVAAVVVAAALWGLGGTVAAALFRRGADPLKVVAVRTWIAAGGLLVIWMVRRPGAVVVRLPWRSILGFGISVAVANASLFLAIDRLPVAVALVLQNLAPLLVVAWGVVATGRFPAPRTILGLSVALASVALVVELPTAPIAEINLVGVVFGILTAAAVASYSAFGATAARRCGALTTTTWAFVISSVGWVGYQVPRGVLELAQRPDLLLGAIALGIFGTLVPFLLFSWGTARVGPTIGAVSISLEPLFGAALAWVWLGQKLTATQLVGAVVLLAVLADVQRARHADRSASEPLADRPPELSPVEPGS